jgi:hypothetical protein
VEAKWLGDREIPQEFLQLAAIENARLRGGPDASSLEEARPTSASGEGAEEYLEYMQDSPDPLEYLDARIIGPESITWEDSLAQAVLDNEANSEVPHFAKLLSYFLPAIQVGADFVYGYWLYPGEAWPPPIACADTEGTLFAASGASLAEALLSNCKDDAEVALLGQWFTNLGLSVTVRSVSEIPDSLLRMDPEKLERKLSAAHPHLGSGCAAGGQPV